MSKERYQDAATIVATKIGKLTLQKRYLEMRLRNVESQLLEQFQRADALELTSPLIEGKTDDSA